MGFLSICFIYCFPAIVFGASHPTIPRILLMLALLYFSPFECAPFWTATNSVDIFSFSQFYLLSFILYPIANYTMFFDSLHFGSPFTFANRSSYKIYSISSMTLLGNVHFLCRCIAVSQLFGVDGFCVVFTLTNRICSAFWNFHFIVIICTKEKNLQCHGSFRNSVLSSMLNAVK